MESKLSMAGALSVRLMRQKAPLSWKIRNAMRWSFIWGLIVTSLAKLFSWLTGVPTLTSTLRVVHIRGSDKMVTDYGIVSRRVITTAGVAHLVDDWQAGTPRMYNVMHFHGCGTGAAAEASSDTALGTESTTALNPDSTRATGTDTQPSSNVFQSVGTLTFDAGAAITEHGILSQAATGGGTLWDRSVFTAINVVSADSIQFTYQCTISAGG